jgi:sulfate adenylyltransferase
MEKNVKPKPLSNLLVPEEQQAVLKSLASAMPDIILNDRQLCDFELLATGVFSPLKGFMKQMDYESVLDRMRLESGELWPLPVCLDIPENLAATLETGQSVTLRDPEGFLLGIMAIEDIWPLDREKEAQAAYNTLDPLHPGVDYLYNTSGRFYIGGDIQALSLPIHSDFKQIRNTPAEVRKTFEKLCWKRVVGFQTRQPIHRPQFEMTLLAMQQAKANLLLLPVAGMTKPGDFDHFTRMRCYQKVAARVPSGRRYCQTKPVFRTEFFQGTPGYQCQAHRICGFGNHKKPGHRHLRPHCPL